VHFDAHLRRGDDMEDFVGALAQAPGLPPAALPEAAASAGPDQLPARTRIAMAAGLAGSRLSKLGGYGNGTVIGGWLTVRIDRQALRRLSRGRSVALVSATNGKSTTSRLLADAVRTTGPVAFNGAGSNMEHGLVMALVEAPAAGKAVLEVDEAFLGPLSRATRPRVITLMNLSREYTRGVSLGRTVRHWRAVAAGIDWPCTLVANADDPLVASVALSAPEVVWVAGGLPWRNDARLCPACSDVLRFQADDWQCAGCGLRRPQPTWRLRGTSIQGPGIDLGLRLRAPGRWVSSNALFALASAVTLGTPADGALAAISRVDDVGGRYAPHDVGGHQVRLFLVKNTASLNEAVTLGEAGTPIVFAMEAFGIKDMAPLWDAPLERLAGRTVVASGQRRRDLAARLEVAGIDFRVVKDPLDAVRSLPAGPVHVVANYTAFLDLKRRLHR
jgi:UDP-N-acetylmuramyl tripeptide synthase